MIGRLSAAAACAGLWLALRATPVLAEPEDATLAEAFGRAEASLRQGAMSEAIDRLELWSDRGEVHPDLSFNRGVAYLRRAESSARRRGDLAQAVAAFEEARHLDPSDSEAASAAERVREAISERRAERRDRRIVVRPRLLRAVLSLSGETPWAVLAMLGSLAAAAGLALRWGRRGEVGRVASNVLGSAGGVLLLVGAAMSLSAWHFRTRFSEAVVVAEEARLLDEGGRPISADRGPSARDDAGDRIPEGSLVYVAETRGGLARVEWGDREAWVQRFSLRPLAEPR